MAGSVNKALIIGNVGKDPEVRSIGHDGKVANLTVATSDKWTDKKSGEKKERTEWHRVSVFGRAAETVERFVSKGDLICIEGQIQTRKWTDNNGQDRYTTEIVVRPYNGEITFLSPPKGAGPSQQRNENFSRPQSSKPRDDWRDDGGPPLNDEIPFAPEVR